MWSSIQLPYIFERMIGFSIPKTNQVAIVSYEGIHLVDLDRPENVRSDPKYPEGREVYDPNSGKLTYQEQEYAILGLYGGSPIHKSERGERLNLDLEGEQLRI